MTEPAPAIVLTDPSSLPKDGRCPGTRHDGRPCLADASKRVLSGGFGDPHEVCSVCGFQDFPKEDDGG